MAGKIEIRRRGDKFRLAVVNSRGETLLQSAGQDDKATAKRSAASLIKAVTGAEIVDVSKPAAAPAAKKPAARNTSARKTATRKTAARKTATRKTGTRRAAAASRKR